MDRKPPQRAPNLAVGVPIIGERKFKQICREGHYEEVTHPFQMVVPTKEGAAAAVRICRACWLDFINENFSMRPLTDEEADEVQARAKAHLEQADTAPATERKVVAS